MLRKKIFMTIISSIFLLSLVGCMYPEDQLAQNKIPHTSQITMVQTAVDQYQAETNGLLPIKTRDMSTPLYHKYPIDFTRLAPTYLPDAPGSAYENGGAFQYVLVGVEEDPQVKLLDILSAEKVRDLTIRLNAYRQSKGYPPFDKQVSPGIFTLNYKDLGYKENPVIKSPYTGNLLPLVLANNGEVYIDYSMDLYHFLQKYKHSYKEGEDIRSILVQHSDFVPAFSLPYTIKNNEPIFLLDK